MIGVVTSSSFSITWTRHPPTVSIQKELRTFRLKLASINLFYERRFPTTKSMNLMLIAETRFRAQFSPIPLDTKKKNKR